MEDFRAKNLKFVEISTSCVFIVFFCGGAPYCVLSGPDIQVSPKKFFQFWVFATKKAWVYL